MDDRRLPRHRQLEIHDGRQRVVSDDDRIGGIPRDVAIARHDDGDRLAAVADRVHGDRTMFRRGERRADRHGRQELGDLRAGEDRFDAVHRLRGARVDGADTAVRDVAALERQVLHADEGDVVDVGAAALNETRVLAPLDALAHELRQHGRRGHGLPLVGGVLNGVDDVLVAGAAAEVAGDALADLALRRRRVVFEQRHGRHDHPRRAVAALEAVLLPEAFLQGMQLTVRREALDRRDRGAVGLDREDRAGLRAPAVDEDGAGAALTGVAPDVRAGQAQVLAEEVDEKHARVDVSLAQPCR